MAELFQYDASGRATQFLSTPDRAQAAPKWLPNTSEVGNRARAGVRDGGEWRPGARVGVGGGR